MLQQLIAHCPHAVVRDKSYPQLLQELLRRAAPSSGIRRGLGCAGREHDNVGSRNCEQTHIRQQAPIRCLALLAAHDERAMLAMVNQVLPAALADASELCWQNSLAECSNAFDARDSMPCRPSGEGSEEVAISMHSTFRCMMNTMGMGAAAERSVLQTRSLCRLALQNSTDGIA